MTPAPIPQTDPRAGYFEQKAEIDAAIARVLASGQYILGHEVGGLRLPLVEAGDDELAEIRSGLERAGLRATTAV